MANGVLGEARVRAMLLERFTVLTRSIDTNGADFLVELRDAGRFSDDLGPRLGIVQAKFAQDDATSHEIAPAYVSDNGSPIDEFFVLVTVGHEDTVAHHLLSGAEVAALPVTRRKGKDVHVLTHTVRTRFRVRKVSTMLDRIEQSLRSRTEAQNERFLRSVNIPDFEITRGALAPTWLLPIPNEHGYIPDLIYRLRIGLRSTLYSLDGIVGPITELMKASDATRCVKSLDDFVADHAVTIDGKGATVSLEISHFEEDRQLLTKAVRMHRRRATAMRRAGYMDPFVQVATAIQASHVDFINDHREPELVPAGRNSKRLSDKHALTHVIIDPITSLATSVVTTLVPAGTSIPLAAGTLAASRELWKYGWEGGATTWRELDRLLHELVAQYYRSLFPTEKMGKQILPSYMTE